MIEPSSAIVQTTSQAFSASKRCRCSERRRSRSRSGERTLSAMPPDTSDSSGAGVIRPPKLAAKPRKGSARYRLAKLTGNQPLLVAALRDRSAERDVVAAADVIIATSDEDADELRQLVAGADVHIVPAVDARSDRDVLVTATRTGIVFLGYLGIVENEIAVRRLIEKVWPLVEAEFGPISLTVVGAAPPEWLLAFAEAHPRLVVTGHLTEIDEVLRRAAVTMIPLSGGAGVKTKVLQAFANGLPVVATTAGIRGVPAVHGVHALLAESDGELAAAAIRILRNPGLGRALTERAATLIHEQFSDDVYRAALQKALA